MAPTRFSLFNSEHFCSLPPTCLGSRFLNNLRGLALLDEAGMTFALKALELTITPQVLYRAEREESERCFPLRKGGHWRIFG